MPGERPAPEEVLAGQGMYYDAEGNSCAVCVRCGVAIDLQHDAHYEISAVRRLGIVAEGPRWWWCGGCADNNMLPVSWKE